MHNPGNRRRKWARNARVVRMRAQGKTYREIGAAFGISTDRARRINLRDTYEQWILGKRFYGC